jgi:hypothetical protein
MPLLMHCHLTDVSGAANALGWSERKVLQALKDGILKGSKVNGKAKRLFLTEDLNVYSATELAYGRTRNGELCRHYAPVGNTNSKAYGWAVIMPDAGTYERACLEAGPEKAHELDPADFPELNEV